MKTQHTYKNQLCPLAQYTDISLRIATCAVSASVLLPFNHDHSKDKQSYDRQKYDAAHNEEYLVLNDSRKRRGRGEEDRV